MSNVTGGQGCPMKCWSVAGAIGVITALILIAVAGKGVLAGLFLGILAAVLLGLLFNWLFCAPVPAIGASKSDAIAEAPVAEPAMAAPSPSPAPVAVAPAAPVSAEPVEPASIEADEPDVIADTKEATAEASDSVVKQSTALAGQDELSQKKGDWRYEGGDAPEAVGPEADEPEAAPKPDTSGAAGTVIKPSTALAGQVELAEKKGTWRYEGGDGPSDAAKSDAAPTAAVADVGEDYDRDGVLEGTEEGTRPALLDGPGEGGADNLKEIKGIGPKLEKVCHGLGVYHFSQIAAWSENEVAWANANLVGFKGRVTRDNWVEQAKILAAGGETEFSKRVDKGGVY